MFELSRARRLAKAVAVLLGMVLFWSLLAPELAAPSRTELAVSNQDTPPLGDLGPTALGPGEASEGSDPEIEDTLVHGYTLTESMLTLTCATSRVVGQREQLVGPHRGHYMLARERGPPLG